MVIVVANLLPLIIGAAVGGPMWIITALLMLRGEGGVLKAAAFAAGATTVRLLQGLLFGYVFGAAAEAGDERGSDLIASTLLLVVGVFLLVTAVRTWCKDEDPDAPPPRWMTSLSGVSALAAFGIGALAMALAMKQWIFTLSALAVIEEAKLGYARSVLVYLFFIVAAQSLMLAPIIISAVGSTQAARTVGAMQAWLERYNRAITIAVSLVFGVWLLGKGASGLLSGGKQGQTLPTAPTIGWNRSRLDRFALVPQLQHASHPRSTVSSFGLARATCHGQQPSSSTARDQLKNVRTRTSRPSTPTFIRDGSRATVLTTSPATRKSSPSSSGLTSWCLYRSYAPGVAGWKR